jgi:hypothetical protein
MRKFIQSSMLIALATVLPGALWAQTNSIESEANLKDSTTHVVVERQVIETTKTYQQDTPRDVQRKVVIIVENRASADLNDKVSVLEDLVASRVAGRGLAVISRDQVTRSLKNYSTGKDPSGELNAVDRSLEDNTSALRLAQNLGADYILVPSLISLGTEQKNYSGNGISTVNTLHRMLVSYKIVEAGEGGAVRGGAFTSEENIRQTANLQTDDGDVINKLLNDVADQLAGAIVESAKTLPAQVAKAAPVNFQVSCTMTDPRQQPIVIAAVGITADNHVVVTNQPPPVQALDVTVELDGTVIGSAPGTLQARPGLHKIRLSHEGFDVWERTVNVSEGQKLNVALQMSADGYARWADTTGFLATLDNNRKLTDAEVKRLEGLAEFFKNSHYRVDTKENVHVTYKSLY